MLIVIFKMDISKNLKMGCKLKWWKNMKIAFELIWMKALMCNSNSSMSK